VHELVDRLAPSQVVAVRGLLEAMLDPVARAMTEEDRTRFREGQARLAKHGGKGIPMEHVLAEFGLKPEDFPTASENAE